MQRYNLDLSEFYSDRRQKIFVRRRDNWTHISCLTEYIRNTFKLPPEICLVNQDDVLFPEEEDLDVVLETDQIRIRKISDGFNGTHEVRSGFESSSVGSQNCKQKGTNKNQLEISSSSSSESEKEENISKILTNFKDMAKSKETLQELPKSKRKRIRKHKPRNKQKDRPLTTVIVKTFGKNATPAVIAYNEDQRKHTRFSEDDLHNEESKVIQPYKNLDKNVIPRRITASGQSADIVYNNKAPQVPVYDGSLRIKLEDLIGPEQGTSSRRKKYLSECLDTRYKAGMAEENTSIRPESDYGFTFASSTEKE